MPPPFVIRPCVRPVIRPAVRPVTGLGSYLLDWRFTQGIPADFAALHSRDSGALEVKSDGLWGWAKENLFSQSDLTLASLARLDAVDSGVVGPVPTDTIYKIEKNDAASSRVNFNVNAIAGRPVTIVFYFRNVGGNMSVRPSDRETGGGSGLTLESDGSLSGSDVTNFQTEPSESAGDGWWRYKTVWTPLVTGSNNLWINVFGSTFEEFELTGVTFQTGTEYYGHLFTSGSERYSPRLTHDPVTLEPLGYLHEQQATNLALNSNLFAGIGGASVSSDYAQSPSGQQNAWKCEGATGSWGGDYVSLNGTQQVSSSADYVGSTWVKATEEAGSATVVDCMVRDDSTGLISTETVALTGEWHRAEMPITTGASTTSCRMLFGNADGDFLIWHGQFEAGSKASSPIITNGAAAIRQGDSVTINVPEDSDGIAYVTYGDLTTGEIAVTPGGTWDLPKVEAKDFIYNRIYFKA